jgi:hypothetical protein
VSGKRGLFQGFYGIFKESKFAHGRQSLALYTFGKPRLSLHYIPMPLVRNNTRFHQDLYSVYHDNFDITITTMFHHKHVVVINHGSKRNVIIGHPCHQSCPMFFPSTIALYVVPIFLPIRATIAHSLVNCGKPWSHPIFEVKISAFGLRC